MKNLLLGIITAALVILVLPAVVYAHVVVTPARAGVGQTLIFNVSVPNERKVAVTSLKLDIPKGVDEVTPTVTQGFTISTEVSGDKIDSITWKGKIPVGQRGDFSFRAQMPAAVTQINWKAYQTYADGAVVQWNQSSDSDDEAGNTGPYSVTEVTNDLNTSNETITSSNTVTLALMLSIIALLFAITSLLIRHKK